MNKSKLGVLSLIFVLLLSYTVTLAAAQYTTQKTTDIAIDSSGKFAAVESDVGISYEIQGIPGATGSVNASVYTSNPQPTASIPDGTSLTHFVVVTFNMDAFEFTSAKIVISYSASDVAGISAPYLIYKYIADTNSYIALPSAVDTNAQTITVTVRSISDPLFAIGGNTAAKSEGVSTTSWAILAVAIIIIVVLVVFAFTRLRTRIER
jgi:hypothetical protein